MTMERSLLYVSRKTIEPAQAEAAIADIVAVARARNADLGVTGALAATAGNFAQILEGPEAAIDALMESICRDPRHTEVTVLRVSAITQRSFPDWSMVYAGPSAYFARHIEPLTDAGSRAEPHRVDLLISLLVGLAGK